jgi:dTDP-4-amino-4,6-dideoxygalactose transaminase
LDTKNCISVGNGTDALTVAIAQLGIQNWDEVLTPAFSWISSSETISLCGAKPVFIDIHPETYTIDPDLIESKITEKTKGIVVVHLYGQAAHISRIKEICKKHNLFLIEDCAQAHLTAEGEKYAGTFGDAGAFSFYPTKNLGAYGDAGCIVTNNDELAEKMRRFANHGALEKDDHLIEGMNSRMDTIQAAVLLAKLPHLKAWNEKRRQHAELYNSLLKDVEEIKPPFVRPNTTHTFHIYAIRATRRDDLKKYLLEKGIQTIIHYPKALPNLPAYQYLHHRPDDFPVASRFQDETLSLPIYPELTADQIEYVSLNIRDFYSKKTS